MKQRILRSILPLVVLTAVASIAFTAGADKAAKSEFTRASVDFGIVCSDVKKSVAFYRDVVGLSEIDGFDVPPELGSAVGLADNMAFHVHVLVADRSPTATRVKLMQFDKAKGKKADQAFIHSTLGLSYTTFWVADIDAALKRAKDSKVKLLGTGAAELPGGLYLAVVRDPDGNFVELVGPKGK